MREKAGGDWFKKEREGSVVDTSDDGGHVVGCWGAGFVWMFCGGSPTSVDWTTPPWSDLNTVPSAQNGHDFGLY
ncbi:hypothetical protein TorRG33x02_347930 [Trema orientale]|uniref:Uncharacterized protein n=1 Tax=Trema orientale TaxID=63057 RepID=A0A2P5AKT8_TREOI|nr:hypothetical protein TorRG33x02_347930 [Trema orientale]